MAETNGSGVETYDDLPDLLRIYVMSMDAFMDDPNGSLDRLVERGLVEKTVVEGEEPGYHLTPDGFLVYVALEGGLQILAAQDEDEIVRKAGTLIPHALAGDRSELQRPEKVAERAKRGLSDRIYFQDYPAEVVAKAGAALDPMRELYDVLEAELDRAMEAGDRESAHLIAWLYGRVAGVVTDLEGHVLV